jgi:hypothetical protein
MFPILKERPVMNFWFYIGVHLKSIAALSAEDSSTILQLKYEISLPPALKVSFENFLPLCILLFFKTLLRRTSRQNFQHIFFLLHTIYAVFANEHIVLHKYFRQILNCLVWDTTGKECVRAQCSLALRKVVHIPRLLVKILKLRCMYLWGLTIILPVV